MQLAQPKWKGKIALAGGETDFQPIVTSIARTHGSAAALRWLEALKANAGGHQYPDNETVVDKVNRGQVALGVDQPVLLVPDAAQKWVRRTCIRPSPTSRRVTWAT